MWYLPGTTWYIRPLARFLQLNCFTPNVSWSVKQCVSFLKEPCISTLLSSIYLSLWIYIFHFRWLVANHGIPIISSIAGRRRYGFMPFPKVFYFTKVNITNSTRIQTQFADSSFQAVTITPHAYPIFPMNKCISEKLIIFK